MQKESDCVCPLCVGREPAPRKPRRSAVTTAPPHAGRIPHFQMLVTLAVSTLLVSAAGAAALAPEANAPNATSRLEALVATMAKSQKTADPAPAPKLMDLEEQDVLILDAESEENRRHLASCNCRGGYRQGASAAMAVCAKYESGGNVCYPVLPNGLCGDANANLCGARLSPQASPMPLASIEVEEVAAVVRDVNLNVVFQMQVPSQLAEKAAIETAIAARVNLDPARVSVVTTTAGEGASVRAAEVVNAPTEGGIASQITAVVHATFRVNTDTRAIVLDAIQRMRELPVGNEVYRVLQQQVVAADEAEDDTRPRRDSRRSSTPPNPPPPPPPPKQRRERGL